MKKDNLIGVFVFSISLIINNLFAQVTPTPASAQSEAVLIVGATAHLGNGKVIQSALIGFDKGKLTLVADATTAKVDRSGYKKVIDAVGKHVYPGLIAPNTPLGLFEIPSVRATDDQTEIGDFNTPIRSIVAYNTDSHIPPTVRANGILLAQIVPNGGRISGQSSVVELDAWNWEDAAYKMDGGMHVRFPSYLGFNFDPVSQSVSFRKNDNFAKQVGELDDFFKEAKAYVNMGTHPQKKLKFEAMRGVFTQEKILFIHANALKEITEGVLFGKKYGCRTVIVGGREAYQMPDLLKANNVSVILEETQALPSRPDDDIDLPFKNPALLQKAGVSFCMSVSGGWQQRNLALMAGQAVGFGLDKEAAVKAITGETAKILGIDKTVGTLEVGKDATLFVSEGDVLDMRTSILRHAFIRGKAIDLSHKQKQLYDRFLKKYGK
jgi:imidazolonepropionase-like amidohydrolase